MPACPPACRTSISSRCVHCSPAHRSALLLPKSTSTKVKEPLTPSYPRKPTPGTSQLQDNKCPLHATTRSPSCVHAYPCDWVGNGQVGSNLSYAVRNIDQTNSSWSARVGSGQVRSRSRQVRSRQARHMRVGRPPRPLHGVAGRLHKRGLPCMLQLQVGLARGRWAPPSAPGHRVGEEREADRAVPKMEAGVNNAHMLPSLACSPLL